jgi:hypothetical protein
VVPWAFFAKVPVAGELRFSVPFRRFARHLYILRIFARCTYYAHAFTAPHAFLATVFISLYYSSPSSSSISSVWLRRTFTARALAYAWSRCLHGAWLAKAFTTYLPSATAYAGGGWNGRRHLWLLLIYYIRILSYRQASVTRHSAWCIPITSVLNKASSNVARLGKRTQQSATNMRLVLVHHRHWFSDYFWLR